MKKRMKALPLYKCHKVVSAIQITGIRTNDIGDGYLCHGTEGVEPVAVSYSYMDRYSPQVGGYYIMYEDGYKSYSPKEAFEGGYTLLEKEVEED